MNSTFKYLGHSKGSFEPEGERRTVEYDKVELSNGLRAFKVKNRVHESKLKDLEPELEVRCTFSIDVAKNGSAVLILDDIEPLE